MPSSAAPWSLNRRIQRGPRTSMYTVCSYMTRKYTPCLMTRWLKRPSASGSRPGMPTSCRRTTPCSAEEPAAASGGEAELRQVHVAAADDDTHPRSTYRDYLVHNGRGGQAARGLDDDLHALREKAHMRTQLIVADGHDVPDQPLHHGKSEVADARRLRAVRDGTRHRDTHDAAAAERLRCVIAGFRLDTVDLAAWRQLSRRDGATGEQATAADTDEQEVELPCFFQQFLRHGALSRDHVGIVEGHHQGRAALGDNAPGDRLAILAFAVVGNHLRAVRLGRRPLDRRRIARHHDGGLHAQQAGGPGDGLGVVARWEG